MAQLSITCPGCGFSRTVESSQIPDGSLRVTCPRCRNPFVFDKSASTAPRDKTFAANPAEPRTRKQEAAHTIRPADAPRPEPEEYRASKKKTRSSRSKKIIAALLLLILIAITAASVYAHIFRLYPVIAEKAYIAGLFSNIEPAQKIAIGKLREYPTKHAAISLVLFINLKNMRAVPDPNKPESPEEKRKRDAEYQRGLILAEQATETLCLLTEQNFGTRFKKEGYGHSWSGIEKDHWPRVLFSINTWAVTTLGSLDLPAISIPADFRPVQEQQK